MKLVIDANIIISAYTCNGETRKLWQKCLGLHNLFISPEIFAEIERNLRKTEFGFSPAEIRAILLDVLERSEIVRLKSKFEESIPNEQDRHLPILASEVGADLIVTGDKALLALTKLGNVPVICPSDFAKKYSSESIKL